MHVQTFFNAHGNQKYYVLTYSQHVFNDVTTETSSAGNFFILIISIS